MSYARPVPLGAFITFLVEIYIYFSIIFFQNLLHQRQQEHNLPKVCQHTSDIFSLAIQSKIAQEFLTGLVLLRLTKPEQAANIIAYDLLNYIRE